MTIKTFAFFAAGAFVVLAALALWVTSPEDASAQLAADVCVHRYELVTDIGPFPYWSQPFADNIVGSLDLDGDPDGWGLFVYDQPMGRTGMHCKGADLDAPLTAAEADTIGLLLNRPLGTFQARSMRDLIKEIYTEEADPAGITGVKPVRMSKEDGLQIWLQPYGKIVQERYNVDSPEFTKTVEVFRADYRRLKAAGEDAELLRKMTGAEMLVRFGRINDANADILMPPEHRTDGYTRPETTVTEDCAGTDTTRLINQTDSGGNNWVSVDESLEDYKIQTNRCEQDDSNAATHYVRQGTALSDDAIHIELTTVGMTGSSISQGIRWRKDSSATKTWYLSDILTNNGGSTYSHRLFKQEAGSFTAICSSPVADTYAVNAQFVAEHTAADALTISYDGVENYNCTDSAITGNTYCGISGAIGAAGGTNQVDNYECRDLSAAAARRIIFIGAFSNRLNGLWDRFK